ncbi:MAG: hypothetical protein IJ937_10635 [Treponema sp.]|nr:hypothetical protein [Treponema sp.]
MAVACIQFFRFAQKLAGPGFSGFRLSPPFLRLWQAERLPQSFVRFASKTYASEQLLAVAALTIPNRFCKFFYYNYSYLWGLGKVLPVKVFIKNVTLVFRQLQFCKAKLELYIKNRKFLKETW